MKSGRVTIVGEVKWRNPSMDANLIKDLQDYKLPAMRQDGLKFARDFTTLIISKGGYTASLRRAARESNGRIVLIDVADILAGGDGRVDFADQASGSTRREGDE